MDQHVVLLDFLYVSFLPFGPILEQLQMLRVISAQTSSSLGQQLMEQLYKKCCKACLFCHMLYVIAFCATEMLFYLFRKMH